MHVVEDGGNEAVLVPAETVDLDEHAVLVDGPRLACPGRGWISVLKRRLILFCLPAKKKTIEVIDWMERVAAVDVALWWC